MHRFASLALKSRIDARKRLFPRKTLQRFPSLALKSRIDAAVWLFLRVSLQRFQSLPLEIRNRCSRGVVAFCRRNHSSLRQRKLESATEDRCRYDRCRRNYSSWRRRRMDIFEGAKEFGTFLETRGNANQNPKRYERHYQTCFISSIGSCGHSGPCQQLRPVKRRKLYNFTQQFFIIA